MPPQLLLNYLLAHLKKCGSDSETEEGKFAQFCQQCCTRTIENKNRKYPPSRQEVRQRRLLRAEFQKD